MSAKSGVDLRDVWWPHGNATPTQSLSYSGGMDSDLLGNLGQRETASIETFSLIELLLAKRSAAHLHSARPQASAHSLAVAFEPFGKVIDG